MGDGGDWKRKSGGLTFGINFFLPGLGHVYATGAKKGWGLFGAHLLGGLLSPFTAGLTLLVSLFVWVVALVESFALAESENSFKEAFGSDEEHAARINRIRATRAQELARMEREREAKVAASEQKRHESKLEGQTVASDLSKIKALQRSGVLSEAEANAEWDSLLTSYKARWTDQTLVDFLGPIALLKEDGNVNGDQLRVIKALHTELVTK